MLSFKKFNQKTIFEILIINQILIARQIHEIIFH